MLLFDRLEQEVGKPASRGCAFATASTTPPLGPGRTTPANAMLTTPGTLSQDPAAGLLFVNWDSGSTLQLSGTARNDWAPGHAAPVVVQRGLHLDVARVPCKSRAGDRGRARRRPAGAPGIEDRRHWVRDPFTAGAAHRITPGSRRRRRTARQSPPVPRSINGMPPAVSPAIAASCAGCGGTSRATSSPRLRHLHGLPRLDEVRVPAGVPPQPADSAIRFSAGRQHRPCNRRRRCPGRREAAGLDSGDRRRGQAAGS